MRIYTAAKKIAVIMLAGMLVTAAVPQEVYAEEAGNETSMQNVEETGDAKAADPADNIEETGNVKTVDGIDGTDGTDNAGTVDDTDGTDNAGTADDTDGTDNAGTSGDTERTGKETFPERYPGTRAEV